MKIKINKVLNTHWHLDLENNNLIWTQNTPAYDVVPSNKMWLQKDHQFSKYGRNGHVWLFEPSLWPWTWRQRTNLLAWHSGAWWCINIPRLDTEGSAAGKILSRWTFTEIYNLSMTLILTTTEHSNLFTRQSSLVRCAIEPSCKRMSSSEDIILFSESHILITDYVILCCDLYLEDSKQSFWKTIWLLMMHHHIKFETKSSKDIIWLSGQTFINILKFCCDLDLEHNNLISP